MHGSGNPVSGLATSPLPGMVPWAASPPLGTVSWVVVSSSSVMGQFCGLLRLLLLLSFEHFSCQSSAWVLAIHQICLEDLQQWRIEIWWWACWLVHDLQIASKIKAITELEHSVMPIGGNSVHEHSHVQHARPTTSSCCCQIGCLLAPMMSNRMSPGNEPNRKSPDMLSNWKSPGVEVITTQHCCQIGCLPALMMSNWMSPGNEPNQKSPDMLPNWKSPGIPS